jgi:hypothetical protein
VSTAPTRIPLLERLRLAAENLTKTGFKPQPDGTWVRFEDGMLAKIHRFKQEHIPEVVKDKTGRMIATPKEFFEDKVTVSYSMPAKNG